MSTNADAVVIRNYRPEDLPAARQVTVDAFAPLCIDVCIEKRFGLVNGTGWRQRKAAQIDDQTQANPDGVFVAEVDGRLVGLVTSELDPNARIGRIPNLAVAPAYQGRGIGKRLMTACLEYFRTVGMQYVKIETMVGNELADRYYRKLGFQEVARNIHFFAPIDDLSPEPQSSRSQSRAKYP